MLRKWFLIVSLLLIVAIPAPAQDNRVTFDRVSFAFDATLGDGVNIARYPGDPVESAGPGFSDAAKTQFTLYQFGEPLDSLFDTGGVRVYLMTDLAQYDFLQAQVAQLESMLAERPDLAAYAPGINEGVTLPYVPVLTHGQNLTARAHYVETEHVAGITYLTAVRAALEPFGERDFMYTFQGISTDGQYYITVTFPLTTALFPPLENFDFEAFQQQWPQYLSEALDTLNSAAPDAFSPALDNIDALIASIVVA